MNLTSYISNSMAGKNIDVLMDEKEEIAAFVEAKLIERRDNKGIVIPHLVTQKMTRIVRSNCSPNPDGVAMGSRQSTFNGKY